MTRSYKAAVIVPIHNALEYVEQTVNRLDLYNPYMPLILVDDGSDPATKAWLTQYMHSGHRNRPETYLLTNERQQLFTRTVNRGLRFAYARLAPEYLVVMNSDVEIKGAWFSALAEIAEADPKVGIVGYPDTPAGGRPKTVRLPEYVTGHCLLLRTTMLEAIGVLSETDLTGRDSPELAPFKGQAHIGSDRILSYRANLAGWKSVLCHEPAIAHAAGKSWHHDLNWLAAFDLQPLWPATDTLAPPRGWTENP